MELDFVFQIESQSELMGHILAALTQMYSNYFRLHLKGKRMPHERVITESGYPDEKSR